jgi:basic membrane lipoprotein Med (substrate-binding protein (PBP1-ABC) superfamily)
MLAGGLTKSNIIGAVGAMPIPEVNRLINAYIAGARSVNDQVEVKVSFIDSFFDPATAKEAALAQIDAGADVLYAERDGVIEAAQEKGVLAIGNMSDQGSLAPDNVVVYLSQQMRFRLPVNIGDTITAEAEVTAVDAEKRIVTVRTDCTNQNGDAVVKGEATVLLDPGVNG